MLIIDLNQYHILLNRIKFVRFKNLECNALLPRKNMTRIILAIALTLGALQADNIVSYDTPETKKPQITKPNHPTVDLYR